MSNDILGSLLRVLTTVPECRLGLLQDYANKLAAQDGEEWVEQGKKFLRKEPSWANGQVTQVAKPTPSILELVSTVVVSATTSKFVAKDRFKLKRDGGICSYLGDNFKMWFLNGDGKIEEPIMEQTLRYHKLRQSPVDGPIITELGGEEKSETTLTEMFSLMEKQKNGEDGVLLNNGYANIFYIRYQNGVLRTVYVFWFDVGWGVSASSVERTHTWDAGSQVFCRNSVLEPSETSVPAQA